VQASTRRERAQLVAVLRAEGKSWADIAGVIQHRFGVNPRVAFRWAHGWTQDDVARQWCSLWPDEPRTNQNLSTWERWPQAGHEPSLQTLGRLARIYACDASDLVTDMGRYRHLDAAPPPTIADAGDGMTGWPPASRHARTDRRTFTKAAVLAALGITDSLRHSLAAPPVRRVTVIGPDHVRVVEEAITHIEERDAAVGAGDLRAGVTALHGQVGAWLNQPEFSVHDVEGELHALHGELGAWSGWLAFDADDHTRARSHMHDALVTARLLDDPRLEVRAMSYLCLLALASRPRESLQCAEAALRLARGWAPPRLKALLHMRAARAHASLDQAKAFGREMAHALAQLDRGDDETDPVYVRFVTPGEATGIAGLSYLAMGRPDRAARSFAEIVQHPDPTYRRNVGYYTVRLAEATALDHDIETASTVGVTAIPLVSGLGSARTARNLRVVRARIEPHRRALPAARDFAAAYDDTFAR
jgi:hypothetical protein